MVGHVGAPDVGLVPVLVPDPTPLLLGAGPCSLRTAGRWSAPCRAGDATITITDEVLLGPRRIGLPSHRIGERVFALTGTDRDAEMASWRPIFWASS